MAIYDNLPVFKATYDLLLTFINQSRNLERDFRYTVGQDLKKELMSLCTHIYQANITTEDREGIIASAQKKMVIIKLNFRLLHDTHQISDKQFAMFIDKTDVVSQQLSAWMKYMKRNKTE